MGAIRSLSMADTEEQGKIPSHISEAVENFKSAWRSHHNDAHFVIAVHAIRALLHVIENSRASTMMELELELKCASDELKKFAKSSIELTSGCDLYLRAVTKSVAYGGAEDFEKLRLLLLEHGRGFIENGTSGSQKIATYGDRFLNDGMTVLTNGFDRVVLSVLLHAAQSQTKRFSVIVTEARPDGSGHKMARQLSEAGITVTIILDSAVAYSISKVDMILVGAEGLVENGGILNRIGTYEIGLVAKAQGLPFYVAAESYKFARKFPLHQSDISEPRSEQKPWKPIRDASEPIPPGVEVDNPSVDYTPPSCITLLFTDLGILTPAAVSDELIKLYY